MSAAQATQVYVFVQASSSLRFPENLMEEE